MDNLKSIDKLRSKADISYEEAKNALELNEWDILDAMMYLEEKGKVKKPSISIFYTNEYKEGYNKDFNIDENNKDSFNKRSVFEGFFESVCKIIDTGNNIFLAIKKDNKIILKIPLTALGLLVFFTFWLVIPSVIIALFFDIEFYLLSNRVKTEKVNKVFKKISEEVNKVKKEFKKGIKNG